MFRKLQQGVSSAVLAMDKIKVSCQANVDNAARVNVVFDDIGLLDWSYTRPPRAERHCC